MLSSQIGPFEYVSILISIILGLGITQLLSSYSDLLYNYKKVKFYWPHTLWILFILFLHIQDWFITYQLRNKPVWYLGELMFVLLYPITLFIISKMLVPNNANEEKLNMKMFYESQFPIIFFLVCISALISVLFNVILLDKSVMEQGLVLFLIAVLAYISYFKVQNNTVHKIIALLISLSSILSIIVEEDVWIIK